MHYFMIERLMGLFWVMIQQLCFVCIKYAHDDIVLGQGRVKRLAAVQAIFFLLLLAFCFEREAGLPLLSRLLAGRSLDYYPWAVRIAICAAMILFDSLLVVYFWRIVRVYRKGLHAAKGTIRGDLALTAFVLLLGVGYVVLGIRASERFAFTMAQYMWVGRFFIQLANFFYIALEVGGAILFWQFLRKLLDRRPRGGRLDV